MTHGVSIRVRSRVWIGERRVAKLHIAPTIVTVKSSPMCGAVRDVIAPVIAGLSYQDRIIGHGRSLMQDMAKSTVLGGYYWVALEKVNLEDDIDHLADNNIRVHQLLDKIDGYKEKNPQVVETLTPLRKRLLSIADVQAATLNVMSGAAYSMDFAELMNKQNPMAQSLVPDTGHYIPPPADPFGALNPEQQDTPAAPKPEGFDHQSLFTRTLPGAMSIIIAGNEERTHRYESALLAPLLTVINACR